MTKYVFIGGSGHSGTSLLLNILGAHSRIYPIPKETYVFRRDLTDEQIRGELDDLARERDKQDVDYICEKSPSHIRKCHEIFRLFPDSKFVAIKREPRDVVASFKRRGAPIGAGIKNWNTAYRCLLKWQKIGYPILSIRFEKLIEDPASTLSAVCAHLGLQYEVGMLDYWQRRRERLGVTDVPRPESPAGKNHRPYRNWQMCQPLLQDRVGNFASLTDTELARVRKELLRTATNMGYQLPPVTEESPL